MSNPIVTGSTLAKLSNVIVIQRNAKDYQALLFQLQQWQGVKPQAINVRTDPDSNLGFLVQDAASIAAIQAAVIAILQAQVNALGATLSGLGVDVTS